MVYGLQNQINLPNDNNKNQADSLLSQIVLQFFKNDFPDTQPKIVNSQGPEGSQQFSPILSNSLGSTGPQQFNPSPDNVQIPQNLMEALTGKQLTLTIILNRL